MFVSDHSYLNCGAFPLSCLDRAKLGCVQDGKGSIHHHVLDPSPDGFTFNNKPLSAQCPTLEVPAPSPPKTAARRIDPLAPFGTPAFIVGAAHRPASTDVADWPQQSAQLVC